MAYAKNVPFVAGATLDHVGLGLQKIHSLSLWCTLDKFLMYTLICRQILKLLQDQLKNPMLYFYQYCNHELMCFVN